MNYRLRLIKSRFADFWWPLKVTVIVVQIWGTWLAVNLIIDVAKLISGAVK